MWIRHNVCALFSINITWNMNEILEMPWSMKLQPNLEISVDENCKRFVCECWNKQHWMFGHISSVYSKCTFVNKSLRICCMTQMEVAADLSMKCATKLTLPVQVLPSEVKSFDLYITTFLWRQNTQHEGVMPIAPKWAGMSSCDLVMSLITTLSIVN